MRLLWARVGVPYSPATGLPIVSQTVSQMVDRVMAMPEGTRLYLLAPIVRGRKGEYRKELADLQKRGFQRVKVDGKMYEIDEVAGARTRTSSTTSRSSSTGWWCGPDLGNRLADSFETALGLADGIAIAENADSGERDDLLGEIRLPGVGLHDPGDRAAAVLVQQPVRRLPGLRRARHEAVFRPGPGRARRRPQPARGRGQPVVAFVVALLHADAAKASPGISSRACTRRGASCRRRCGRRSSTARAASRSSMTYDDGLRQYSTDRPFEGVLPNMERRFRETDSAWVREELGRYQNAQDLRGLPRRAAQARGAGGQDRRQAASARRRRCRSRRRRLVRRRRRDADPEPAARSPRAS